MRVYVEVAINLPQISEPYHYHLPPELINSVVLGSLVIVPFGRQRAQGVVLRFVETPQVAETRPVAEVIDEKPVLTPAQIELAHWLATETLSTLGASLSLMLPSGLSQHTDTLVRLNVDYSLDEATLKPLEKRIIDLLKERGELRGRQIDAAIKHMEWRKTLRRLARKGIVETHAILPPPRVKPKTERRVALAIEPETVERWEEPLSRVKRVHARRLRILQMLAAQADWVDPATLFTQIGAKNTDLKVLEEEKLIKIHELPVWRDPLEEITFVPSAPFELTHDQAIAWEKVQGGLTRNEEGQAPMPILLHGVTGSGKTEIYLKAVQETLNAGKQVIVLVPEIALTPQTVKRFLSRFPGEVGVIHSQLSEGERYDTWRRVRNGEISVIVGPRSALFMPLENLGLIVVDECHHDSYDQQETPPYYRGARTAVACARFSGAAIILGSATPQVTQVYRAVRGDWRYVALPKRILAHREAIAHHARALGIALPVKTGEGETADLSLPQVSIIDMRHELQDGNRSIFSRELQTELQQVLDTNQQAILFLNRRGTATYVFCRDCGYVVKCPRDDKPLTYHSSQRGLLCHTCGYQRKVPKVCPQCGGQQIRQLGTGTEKVEALVRARFPDARTLRWDLETTRTKGAHERILTKFALHQADILIGTQMLAKGLDLPLVTLVGVILAEVGLNLPDYRAAERTFQVLTQVAGRAGRSPLGGKVIFQTYQPENYAIQAAAAHDYAAFYEQEMAYRRELRYPPFSRLVRLEYRHHDFQKAESAAHQLMNLLQEWISAEERPTEIIGPAPCFFSRLYGRYRWQIILRGQDPTQLLRGRQLPDWIVEVDPSSLL